MAIDMCILLLSCIVFLTRTFEEFCDSSCLTNSKGKQRDREK